MEVWMPKYYNEFQCIAGACPDSCCKEWAVDVDECSAAYYRSLPGELGDQLRAVLKDEDGSTVMTITEGRCPMWRKDGLCEIQAQLGHDALCQTCRDFPRLRHDYGDFVELGLELSCPEAAKLILGDDHGESVLQIVPGGTEPEYEQDVMDTLKRSRQEVLDLLQSSNLPLPHMLAVILLYAHDVQAEIDGGDVAVLDVEACLADAKHYANDGNIDSLFDFFLHLDILTEQWRNRLEQGPVEGSWNGPYKALIRYFIQRYWLQAVSDYDLVCRVKFMLAGCLLVWALGGEMISTAQNFSKEIENDADNVEAILDGAYSEVALTDVNLLSLLLR